MAVDDRRRALKDQPDGSFSNNLFCRVLHRFQVGHRALGATGAQSSEMISRTLFSRMTTSLIDCERVRDKFRQWQAEQEPIAEQLSESLAALSAYQTHLDAWQQQLAQERDELRVAWERLDQEQSAADQGAVRLAEVTSELNSAREKIAALTTSLLSRTEELRTLDNRRAEVFTELELARAREKELTGALEELRHTRDQERAQWATESRHLRELLERHLDGPEPPPSADTVEPPRSADRAEAKNVDRTADNPVVASVLEQFGKLRQQRASDRSGFKKTR